MNSGLSDFKIHNFLKAISLSFYGPSVSEILGFQVCTDTGFEASMWKWSSGELDTKAWGVERLVRMADVHLSILYQKVKVNKIPKVMTAEKRSIWACGTSKAMGRPVSPTF